MYSIFPSYAVLDLRGFRLNVKSVQFASRILQCSINCIVGNKFNPHTSEKYQNVLHESYQINDKVYKSFNSKSKFNRKIPSTQLYFGRTPRNSNYADI